MEAAMTRMMAARLRLDGPGHPKTQHSMRGVAISHVVAHD